MEVDTGPDEGPCLASSLENQNEILSLVSQLLDPKSSDTIIQTYRKDLPELIHHTAQFVTETAETQIKNKFIILCGKLVRYNRNLVQHLEPWLCQVSPPWATSGEEPKSKRSRLDPKLDVELVGGCYWLLVNCERMKSVWSWAEIFPLLTSNNLEMRFIVIEILRLIFSLSEVRVNQMRSQFLAGTTLADWVVKYHIKELVSMAMLAQDTKQCYLEQNSTKVVTLDHVSLTRKGPSMTNMAALVEVNSTKENLLAVGSAVSVGQPVLLVGEVGVGKTSLVVEWGARTGREVLTLQVSDNTDARLLVGLYRCTDLPGQFVWEAGLLTRAVTTGAWLLIEDIDRAPQEVVALLAPLVQEGILTVPTMGGQIRAAPGFQLFLTQREQVGSVREELAKLVRTVTVTSLKQEELKMVISTRFSRLEDITEKILRMFSIITNPQDHTDYSDQVKLVNTLRASRQVSVRDLVKWCKRAQDTFINNQSTQQMAELLYLDAVDIFCRFIPNKAIRSFIAEEIAFTLNISKDQASYFSTVHKPSISIKSSGLQVGRVFVPLSSSPPALPPLHSVFSVTRHTSTLLEAVSRAVTNSEPVLLVGETGVGKTTSVQFLAEKTGRKLKVINMNQQSDSADLLGGFKPVSLSRSLHSLRELFTSVFCETFSSLDNSKFLGHLDTCYRDQRWSDALQLMLHSLKVGIAKVIQTDQKLVVRWKEVRAKIKTGQEMVRRTDLATVFAFIEGTLTEAVKNGDWILLDEVNMAPASVLECLSQLLESEGSITLYEAGDYKSIVRHKDFRLFACMNPATDTGKADLAPGLRNRFTELYCDEMCDQADITMLVTDYLGNLSLQAKQISSIVTFYSQARIAAETSLTNGLGHRPTFSLRTLCRGLKIGSSNPCGSVKRSLYEAFSLAFLTELDRSSHPVVMDLISKYIVGVKETSRLLKQPIAQPNEQAVLVAGFWVKQGILEPRPQPHYILTNTVNQNLADLARIVSLCDHPVLVQGDTSVGKTSLVTYLAMITGNNVVRVNNHEHTDIQEYIGSYTSNSSGQLVFKLGVLAEAMQAGSWVILDELNLAPTDVLEALNRVLDDNRELFIPETGETIRAKSGFRLFGTQNPPGTYGGRKVLSRAFRNRFIELHFDQLPPEELETILTGRCCLPASYSKKMVKVLGELQKFRKGSAAFAGKEGFITLRDLFRWAERYRLADEKKGFYDWDRHLAEEGYLVLAARVRNIEEDGVILDILEKVFKRRVEPEQLFSLTEKTSPVTRKLLEQLMSSHTTSIYPNVAWTMDMRRLGVLLGQAWGHKEPVLLVGETGCGKTTVVEVIAKLNNIQLFSLNCHNNTESSDFLGGLRPDRAEQSKMLFQWVDGPLVQAMRSGGVFLADEISLADDSVLERMNSVLEPEREILLAEKIGQEMDGNEGSTEKVVAKETFRFVGTMNPGGDYGKKELSPALKNRFTEIWCPGLSNSKDLLSIVEKNIKKDFMMFGVEEKVVEFVEWFKEISSGVVSIRDVLSWVTFINTVVKQGLGVEEALWEGAHLVWLDGLQIEGGSQLGRDGVGKLMMMAREKLKELTMCGKEFEKLGELEETEEGLKVGPFSIMKKYVNSKKIFKYSFKAETITANVSKILRGLQISKPILLEGSPGIGKTSLVEALAGRLGQNITRINLSDQTDVADLFGSDLPVEGGKAGQFQWRNGPFLDAMEKGDWILLDELNLASQSVLEGLNAVFDHRNEVFIPELDRTFPLHPDTRIFGCQNPISEGGDRKGLPKSFLNRFSKVFMSGLSTTDYHIICQSMYPEMEREVITRMVKFSNKLEEEVVVKREWGQSGAPWEFNLRDLLRWCQAMHVEREIVPGRWVRVIYGAKMRTQKDLERVLDLYREEFEPRYPLLDTTGAVWVDDSKVCVGQFKLDRIAGGGAGDDFQLLACQRETMEALTGCLGQGWPVVITGPGQGGKTAMVHLMAQLVGVKVETLSLNASTDTMELLGGFEQADLDRSVGDLWSKVVVWVSGVTEELLGTDRVEEGLLFMQRFLQLEQQFQEKSLKRRRKDQVKIISEVVLSVRATNIRVLECEQLLMEVGRLDDNKQGTFEWVDSVLVGAMTRGSWLVLDCANTCSASVLDRLNCLLEEGGKLVVSERGVLGGQVVTVPKHKNFRVFLLYDPIRGEISRAMRNRAVELHMAKPELGTWDTQQLVRAGLGPAAASQVAVVRGEQLLNGDGGLQAKENQLAVLRQDVLAGGLKFSSSNLSKLAVERNLTVVLGSSILAGKDSALCSVVLQTRPLMQIVEKQPRILSLAVEQYLHYMSPKDKDVRSRLVELLIGEEWEQLARQISECKLLPGNGSKCWDWRLLPPSAVRDRIGCSENMSNRLALVIRIMVETKELQDKISNSPSCLLIKSSLPTVSSGLDDPVLLQFPSMVWKLLSLVQSDLSLVSNTPLHDPGWSCLDQGLVWLHHLIMVGVETLDRDSADTLARSITVHWGWVYKRLMKNLEMMGCTNVCRAIEQFDKVVKATTQYTTKSMTKLKRLLDCSPLPPSSISSCSTMSLLTKLDTDPMLGVSVHRARFISLFATKINQSLLLYKAGSKGMEDVARDIEVMVEKYHNRVEQETAVPVSPDNYLAMQVWSLKEHLSFLQHSSMDQQLMSLQHRLLLHIPESCTPQGWTAAHYTQSVLHRLDRPAVKLLHMTEYDPVLQTLASVKTDAAAPDGLVGVFSRMVNVRDASGSTAIAIAEQKIEQLKEMKEILINVKFEKEEFDYDGILAELEKLVKALLMYYGCQDSDSLQSNLTTLLDCSSHFKGFSLLLSELMALLTEDNLGRSQLKVMKLELLLNCLKLQLFSLVGPIDPAEKQSIKQRYALEGLQVVRNRVMVMDTFSEVLGGSHPHRDLLSRREEMLIEEVERRTTLTAVRGEGASFVSLSKDLTHFVHTVGSSSSVLALFKGLEKVGKSIAEAQLWVKSCNTFIRILMNHSTFPDLVIPVAEAAARLMNVMQSAIQLSQQNQLRVNWRDLDRTLLRVANIDTDPSESVIHGAEWLLEGRVGSLFEDKAHLLLLRSSLVTAAQTSGGVRTGELVRNMLDRVLRTWREEEMLKEEKKAEAEAMFKTKTVCPDEDDEAEAEDEYRKLFPTFTEVFSDLVQEDQFGTNTSDATTASATKAVQNSYNQLYDVVTLIQKFLLQKQFTQAELQEAVENQFVERYRLVSRTITNCSGMASSSLEKSIIPAIISMINVTLKQNQQTLTSKYDFYLHANIEQASLVKPLLQTVACKIFHLLETFPENPVLLQIIKIKYRISSISANAPLSQFLTGLELLLTSCQEWEKNAHKGVSIQSEMDKVTDLILSWRKLELAGWKVLLQNCLTRVRNQTANYWLHVVGVVMESGTKKEEVVRSLVRFMEAGSLADFQSRLDILESVSVLLDLVGHKKPSVLAALRNLHTYFAGLNPGVEQALKERFGAAESKVKEFIKMARWKDTSFWSVKGIVEKTRKTLHKTMREYQKSISLPCKNFFTESASDSQGQEQKDQTASDVVCCRRWSRVVSSDNEVTTAQGKDIGSLQHLDKRAAKWTGNLLNELKEVEVVSDLADLLPSMVSEMEKLKGLIVDKNKAEPEQKKQAGFIQQRKRAGLNDLFKTLQNFGFSYRFGLLSCSQVDTYRELFSHAKPADCKDWGKSEKYFYRCFSRFRQLLPLLDGQLPPDVSSMLGERFQGFSQHMLQLAVDWREMVVKNFAKIEFLTKTNAQFDEQKKFDLNRNGNEFRSLLAYGLETVESCHVSAKQRLEEYQDLKDLKIAADKCEVLKAKIETRIKDTPSVFVESACKVEVSDWSSITIEIVKVFESCKAIKKFHPVSENFEAMSNRMRKFQQLLDNWIMKKPATRRVKDDGSFQKLLDRLVVKCLMGVQESLKKSKEFLTEEISWMESMKTLLEMSSTLKTGQVKFCLEKVVSVLGLVAGLEDSNKMFESTKDVSSIVGKHLDLAQSVQNITVLALLQFNKFLSVMLKIFNDIAVNGFCPPKELDEDGSKTSDEFKTSEEETGLGQGEGSKDVSDQIDNEDMLDGAYQNQEDANETEDQENKEEDNGIEMSDNFDSNMQDKKDEENEDEDKDDKENELEDETGEVEGNEDLDKDMWGDENEDDNDQELDDSEEKGKTEEEEIENLSAKEDQKEKADEEKRTRKDEEKEKEEENQEFDDNQTDPYHGEDKQMPEPEAFELPDNMDLDEKEQEDNFEEGADNEPESMPDFEEEEDKSEDLDENEENEGKTEIDKFEDSELEENEEKMDESVTKDGEEDPKEEDVDEKKNEERLEEEHSGMDVDEEAGQEALENQNELDQDKRDQGSEGLNEDKSNQSSSDKSFGIKGKDDETEDEAEAGAGTAAEQDKSLADNTDNAERLDIVEGDATGEDDQGQASIYRHVMDQRDDDKSAIDKADEKDVKEQVLPDDWDMEKNEEKQQKISQMEEDKLEKEKTGEKSTNKTEDSAAMEEEGNKIETPGDFTPTYNISRGTDSLITRQQFAPVARQQQEMDTSLSLETVQLSDSCQSQLPVLTQLSHQLCEQLRLILEPTKASKLQGDFRTGKRLNMRKIIPYIASQFKKDKIWLRRVKPNKREFQILVALDDSSSMSDNQSREIALSSLNTLSSALALLEVGQMGVLRFGKTAEVIHSLGVQWSQSAGNIIQNQFTFEQKETSLVSLLNLSTQLFTRSSSSASRNLSVSQLLVIVSDGRGVFHEGREKVLQSVMKARQAGYFCLFLIVENPSAADSVLDIRLPVFSGGQLTSIDSYMDHFPFQHYIVLRDVVNLPHTLSDALRQWFELVTS